MIKAIKNEIEDYKLLLRNIPSLTTSLFVVAVVIMNLLSNKEIYTGTTWLALDCGLLVSWMSFLCMDMITKRFGPKAAIKLSILAVAINLVVCLMLFIVSKVPGNWSQYYEFGNTDINEALNNTIGGTWYIVLGSMIAFICSSIANSIINSIIGALCKKDNFVSYALRSYISTLIAQFLDNLIFALIVSHTFFGWSLLQCITCAITGAVVELLCEVIFSPIGYKVCKRWKLEGIGEDYISTKGIG